MSKPALIVLGSLTYPKGSAPTNRIHLYCKALRIAGGSPLVISLDAPFINNQPFRFVGQHEGIPFCFSRGTYIRKDNFLERNSDRLRGIKSALFLIRKRKKRNNNVVVLFFSALPVDELILSFLLKLLGVKIIKECNEAPDFIIKEKRLVSIRTFLLKSIKLKKYDGIIVISNFLKDFFSKLYPVQRIFQIPILVDLDRFKVFQNVIQNPKKVITYIGFIGGNKDGLDDLIESIAIVHRSITNLTINLVGNGYKGDLERLTEKVNRLNLSGIIQILGNKESSEIPVILANSDFLILTRPDNNQAKAGFPTKLGEYLASGKPVIITKTGEVTNYLEDNRSAYLAVPGDIKGIAEKTLFAINDKEAEKVGMEGFRVAERNFDYKLYSNELLNVLAKVLSLPQS
jgi:glycosyltransferase involved in cell wall biosynthesis